MFSAYRQPDLWQTEPPTVSRPTAQALADQADRAAHDAYEALYAAEERYLRLLHQRIVGVPGLSSEDIGAIVSDAARACRLKELGDAYREAADYATYDARGQWRPDPATRVWHVSGFRLRRSLKEIVRDDTLDCSN